MVSKHDYHWTFGDKAHISFPGGNDPVVGSPHAFNSTEGCATMSDSNGNLLFYTDGSNLYVPGIIPPINPANQPLGGGPSSAHSAIIVPPAGGGSLYHIFTTADMANMGQVTYTPVAVGLAVTMAAAPAQLPFGPARAAEKLAAVPHEDCNKYWVVSLNINPAAPGAGQFFVMLIDSDAGPSSVNTLPPQPYPYPGAAAAGYCTKFSPDGKLLATSSIRSVEVFTFNRATGAIGPLLQISNIPPADEVYGVEFSPDSKYLYFTGISAGYIRRHQISLGPINGLTSTELVGTWNQTGGMGTYRVGALQLAPNGVIYGVKVGQPTLFEIRDPNNTNFQLVQFNPTATQLGSGALNFAPSKGWLGLPTFTRIAADCADNCRNLAAMVDEQLAGTPKVNALRPCDKSQPVEKPPCAPVDLPRIAPWTSIRWGDSQCDCIEGDDTEVMHLTVCNPYRNLTLSNLTIHQIVVVQANGAPVANLPDGSPSVQLVPIGPYCFDDLAPCTCVTRQFVLRLRGAVPGPYRILLKGICFDACFHGDEEDCFIFNVCKD